MFYFVATTAQHVTIYYSCITPSSGAVYSNGEEDDDDAGDNLTRQGFIYNTSSRHCFDNAKQNGTPFVGIT